MANNPTGFQPNPGTIVPPHLELLDGNPKPGNPFGYGKGAGPRTLTSTGLTQNAESKKKKMSYRPYNYIDTMSELNANSRKRKFDIQLRHEIYTIENPYRYTAKELKYVLAEKVYDSIRK